MKKTIREINNKLIHSNLSLDQLTDKYIDHLINNIMNDDERTSNIVSHIVRYINNLTEYERGILILYIEYGNQSMVRDETSVKSKVVMFKDIKKIMDDIKCLFK